MPKQNTIIDPKTGLTPTQSEFMDRYLRGEDITAIANDMDVPRGRYYDWCKTEVWRREVQRRTKEKFDRAQKILEESTVEAAQTLKHSMAGKCNKTQMQAAEIILDRTMGKSPERAEVEVKTEYDLNKRAAEILAQKTEDSD